LAGMGAAAGVGAFGSGLVRAAGAVPTAERPALRGLAPSALPPLTPGLSYVLLDGAAFVPDDPSSHPRTTNTGSGYTTTAGFRLLAPLVVPAGSTLKEISVSYLAPAPASAPGLLIFRQPLDGLMQSVTSVVLPESGSQAVVTAPLDEVVDGTSTYNMQFYVGFTSPTAFLFGVRAGYQPPPQAFVPLSPITRVLDTRVTGGKLNISEERVIALGGVPGFAQGAVINLTVTETEGAGFVAVFPADSDWPGNSSINWSAPDQNIANGVLVATDGTGGIRIRGGVSRTHVIVDVAGYLL
jgi:hypothetical protein